MSKADATSQENKAGAAILASGLACFIFGLLVVIAEMSSSVKEGLQWMDPVGPLSGKVGVATLSWIVLWIVLHRFYASRPAAGRKLYRMGLILILLGFLFTFPPFFRLFVQS
jgi:hypothetical protein